MPNKLLKTLSIDGVPNDALGVGDYLKLDTNNNVALNTKYLSIPIDDFSLATGTNVDKTLYTFDKEGLLIGNITTNFSSNSNGMRTLAFFVNSFDVTRVRGNAAGNGMLTLSISFCVNIGVGNIIKGRFWQNSGSSLNITAAQFRGIFLQKVGG